MVSYEPTWESVSTHPLPDWYDDAKLGIFLHWGIYSVPGWAPQVGDIQELLRTEGPEGMLRDNPYAEWYRNTMQIEGSPTQVHHAQTYGADFPYDGFIPMFNEGANTADLGAIADLARDAGAGYVVLTTKHHEGFTLWPASIPNPHKGYYHAERDLVGDMCAAVRDRGMRMGLYYSGGYDWPFNDAVLRKAADSMLAVPATPEYQAYATAHVTEIIDRYRPDVLWNDVAWPPGGDLAALFAHYYNSVPDGVINDRWIQPSGRRNVVTDSLTRAAGDLIQLLWKHIPEKDKQLTFPGAHWYDFRTPEYAVFDTVQDKKWEATRGVGHSFGANRNERPQDIVTATELVHMLVDVVSKNGNLLIGIGPDDHGGIVPEQQAPLRGLGEWMAAHGDVIRGSRPWTVPATETTEGTPVRFVRKGDEVYAILLGLPGMRTFGLRGVEGIDEITLPERMPVEPAYVVPLGTEARWAQEA
ncbi:MAG: alpha-L-fucosidase [Candidatus Nanopelagicales bacterium]